jgi:hypothetical protein
VEVNNQKERLMSDPIYDKLRAEHRRVLPDPENPSLEGLRKDPFASDFVIEVLDLMEGRDPCDNAGELEALARAANRHFWEKMTIRDMLPAE